MFSWAEGESCENSVVVSESMYELYLRLINLLERDKELSSIMVRDYNVYLERAGCIETYGMEEFCRRPENKGRSEYHLVIPKNIRYIHKGRITLFRKFKTTHGFSGVIKEICR